MSNQRSGIILNKNSNNYQNKQLHKNSAQQLQQQQQQQNTQSQNQQQFQLSDKNTTYQGVNTLSQGDEDGNNTNLQTYQQQNVTSHNNLSNNDMSSQRADSNNLQQQTNQQQQQEDEELKKKIALYYHTLFQGCLGQWFVLLQQNNYSKLTKSQYMELNMRIQKSLILDFDHESAQESAIEDWKIDIERESFDKRNNNNKANAKQLSQINEEHDNNDTQDYQEEPFLIDFERLSEFFFDLCLSWCQYLDIETFLFFLNGIFLNITKGSHVNVSTFKELDEIEVLSIEFFNTLLAYRSKCEQIQQDNTMQNTNQNSNGESYKDWYSRNFARQGEIVRSVEKQLHGAFKDKGENRILDLWIDMPTQAQNQYINQHFDKLDKDLKQIHKASKAAEILTQSMNMMEQIKKINLNDKTRKIGDVTFKNLNENTMRTNQTTDQQSNQIFIGSGTQQIRKGPLKISNTKELRQNEIEKHLVGQLGDRFRHAKLLEVSENSYLISADVRLPVFGRPFQLIERTKTSISKRGYLLKMHPEYTNQNKRKVLVEQQSQQNHTKHLVVNNQDLPIHQGSFIQNNSNNHQTLQSQQNQQILHQQQQIDSIQQQQQQQQTGVKNVVYEKIRISSQQHQHQQQQLQQQNDTPLSAGQTQATAFPRRRDSLVKDTLDSESDNQLAVQQQASSSYDNGGNGAITYMQQQVIKQHQQQRYLINQYSEEQKSNINVKVPDLIIPQTQQSSHNIMMQQQQVNINMADGSNIIDESSLLINQQQLQQQQVYNNNDVYSPQSPPIHNYYQSSNLTHQQLEERAINQVYDRYLQLLQEDKNAKVDDILKEESFAREFSGAQLDEQQIEAAVMERLQAEEESAEIQEMIARFYNKFDELHEQSVSLALAKSPNKQQVKNEIKYKIPERWTKRFHKHDIIPISHYVNSAVNEERGRVNKPSMIASKQRIQDQQNQLRNAIVQQHQIMSQQQQQQQQQQNLNSSYVSGSQQQNVQQIPLSNSMLKESLSSRATPKSDFKRRQRSLQQNELQPQYTQQQDNSMLNQQNLTFKHTHVNHTMDNQQQNNKNIGNNNDVNSNFPLNNTNLSNIQQQQQQQYQQDIDADSTDVSKAGDLTRRGSEYINQSSGLCKPQLYDWSEVAHLFENGLVPEELLQISDPIEYNYILVRLKKEFNEKNKSEYIKYMNLQLPYHSRRDEVGGVITHEEWNQFVNRLEGIIDKVKKKRTRMIKRRRKKGNKKLPRKTLFKPIPRPNLGNDPLWREVFLESSSDEDDDAVGSDQENDNFDKDIYQLGLRSVGSQKSTNTTTMFQKNAAQMLGLQNNNDKIQNKQRAGTTTNKKGNKTAKTNGLNLDSLTAEELSLPPIMRPLLYEDLRKNTQPRQQSSKNTKQLRTAEMNLKDTVALYPETKNMLNIRFKDYYYDPFDKEPHKASRMIGQDTGMIQKIDHNYSKKIRKSVMRQRGQQLVLSEQQQMLSMTQQQQQTQQQNTYSAKLLHNSNKNILNRTNNNIYQNSSIISGKQTINQ